MEQQQPAQPPHPLYVPNPLSSGLSSGVSGWLMVFVVVAGMFWFASQMSAAISDQGQDIKTLRQEIAKEFATLQKRTDKEINYKTDDSLLRAQVESRNELFKRDLDVIKEKLKDLKDMRNDQKRKDRETKNRLDDLERTLTQIYSKLSNKKQ